MVQLSDFEDTPLKNASGSTLTASQIWASQPVVIFLIRRPGCVLCRAFANTLVENKGKLDAMGVKLVGIVKEWDQAEIDDFTKKFWPADIFFDESKKIFTSLTDGMETKLSLAQMLNPFSAAWKAARKAKQTVTDHNLKGEGQIPGGLLVMKSGGGGIVYSHLETFFGDHPPIADVLAAAKKASN
mmetsp:Transcript_13054/g.39554  ORF Transcript_13054/g.39554 Transcript_13054/m.39554 type:complete len:185 (+) Transcript_13054:118-672(+)|eukprot:CAMPEP_0206143748 /NCGR_PEP_ID=MMETSP1473-20131121/21671_1 /ASSEMBLY_ACC=CAM_ASM_001109 /TAXON_ID=1461547 /ORGANISM="Stichococcus sp, Strain RCC1054" /LENGTH=184 /DNA_ID=CAMNT_0053539289 /DNA_START=27 /DNA_END=581 /DNA_ORIENTATION=+